MATRLPRASISSVAIPLLFLFVLTGLPALALIVTNRAPRAALAFALAFPATFLVLLVSAAGVLP